MEYFEDWRIAHRNLSAVDLRFRELAKDSPELLERSQFRILDQKQHLLKYPLQSWPTFIGAEKLAELKRVSVRINSLLRSIPERIFRLDAGKLASFYGVQPMIAEVLFSPPTGAETMLSRGDFIETAAGFKCIEFNFTPNLGGWDVAIVTDLHLSTPPTVRFIESEGLRFGFTDPFSEMFRYVIDDLRRKGIVRSGTVTIALKLNPGEVAEVSRSRGHFEREIQQTIAAMGLALEGRVVVCSHQDLTLRGGGIFLDQQKIDAVLDLNGPPAPQVYRAFKGSFVGLYNTPLGAILSNKGNVALLSQHAASGVYTPEERAFIEAHVPWTRLVVPGEVDYAGRVCSLVELLTAHRGQFVLKIPDSQGGKGVLLGKFASAEEWRQTLDKALAEGHWVVQEVQESLPYLYQNGDYGCSIHEMIWGPFVFGDRYGGVVLRMQPRAAGGAVNLSLHATEGIVLEV